MRSAHNQVSPLRRIPLGPEEPLAPDDIPQGLGFRALLELVPAITYLDVRDDSLEEGLRTVYVSGQVEPMFGCTPEEWLADLKLGTRGR